MSEMSKAPGSTEDRRALLEILRHAPRPVWVLVVGVFVNRIGSYFSTFVVLFLTARGFGVGALPGLLTAIGVAAMAGALVGGRLADTVGRKRALVCSMTASALGLVALSFASGPMAVIVAVCVVALCTQSYLPAAAALLTDHTAPADRVPIFALFRVALNLGAALGPLIAGILASVSYQALFLIDGGTCALFALLLVVGLPAKAPPAWRPSAVRVRRAWVPRWRPRTDAPPASGSGAVLLLCLAVGGVAMAYAQHTSTLPLQLTTHGLSTEFYGFLLAFNGVLVIVCEMPLSALTRRWPWNGPLLSGALLICGGMALCGLLAGPIAVLGAVVVWSLGEMVISPVVSTAVADLSPPDRVGRYQARLSAAQIAGFSFGPALGVFFYSQDPLLPWLGCIAVGVCAVILIQLARRNAPRVATASPDVVSGQPLGASTCSAEQHERQSRPG